VGHRANVVAAAGPDRGRIEQQPQREHTQHSRQQSWRTPAFVGAAHDGRYKKKVERSALKVKS
jgi:hypothetical protein